MYTGTRWFEGDFGDEINELLEIAKENQHTFILK